MALSPLTLQVKFYRVATFSRLLSLKCTHSFHRRDLYSQGQTGISLIAFDAKNSESKEGDHKHPLDDDAILFKLYSTIFNKIRHIKSEILAHEAPFVCNLLSFLKDLQGQKQVCGFFSYLIRVFGNSIEIVVKQTLNDGLNIGIQWKFESEKIHVPFGNGLSFYISHSYKGKAMIRNTETFFEPLLQFLPFRVKIMGSLEGLRERIGSFMVWQCDNKAKSIVIALIAIAAFLFFFRLTSFKIVFKLYHTP
ncbi:putative transmembrane protein [Senna tora]|uniref:Putative transmembrane protein n=1 Tax=Senna tora TaxID=362788 RepID=A0A834XBJ7_9FABA|nr:putative transmembrane protein [Senna tora]